VRRSNRTRTFWRGLLGVSVAAVSLVGASSALADGPSAIGQDAQGVSYVGFVGSPSSAAQIARLDASGNPLTPASFSTGVDGSVYAIAVDPSGNVWVIVGEGQVLEFTPSGTQEASFALPPCDGHGSDPANPLRYGGIAVTSTHVYVADSCLPSLIQYNRDGSGAVAVPLPGIPRGVSYDPGFTSSGNPIPDHLYVALPDQDQVLTFDADGLSASSTPVATLSPAAPSCSGGTAATPVPTGVDADVNELIVEDAANQAFSFYDTTNGDSEYRTLGHPCAAGSSAGSVDDPVALAVHAQDGSALADNLFIADYGNGRVQRWDSGGFTYWANAVTDPVGGGVVPVPTESAPPAITGTAAVGETLTCTPGAWTGSPASFSDTWERDGAQIATASTYALTGADAGHALACVVVAENAGGESEPATSAAVMVAAAPSAPTDTAAPTVSGTAAPGSTLSCTPGTWTGSPTFSYVWERDGATVVATTPTYLVQSPDAGHTLTCVVAASNAGGVTDASSAPVAVSAAAPPPPAGTVGVSIDSGAVYTNTPAVTLTIVPPAGASSVVISNDGGFGAAGGTQTLPLAGDDQYAWTLATSGAERLPKVVYVRFAGAGIDLDQTFSDDIILDQTAPTVSMARVVAGSASAARVAVIAAAHGTTLEVRASDNLSGVGQLQYGTTRTGHLTTVPYSATLKVPSVRAAAWVRVIDRAGNFSTWHKVQLGPARAAKHAKSRHRHRARDHHK
jgi:hypothetical protein